VAPLTCAAVYVRPVCPGHTVTLPLIVAGAAWVLITFIAWQLAVEITPQLLVAVTQTLPATVPAFTVILLLPCPELMIHPEGTDHVYETAPFTEDTLYEIFDWLAQTEVLPLIAPGVVEVLPTVMVRQEDEEVIPQALVAVTHISPLVLLEVTMIPLVPCPEVMVQPEGTAQL
jgi:hypothetical protein